MCLVVDLQFALTSFTIPNPLKVKKILWLDIQMNLLMFVHFSWVCKWKIETIAKFVAPQWKLNEKKPYWVWFDAKVRPIGTRRYMWGFVLWVYYHGQNLSIIKVDEHPLIVVVAIWDISLAKFLEYFDYLLLNKAFNVATLLWPSVGVKPNTWKMWGFGVLRDSRMFRVRQQGLKHLALRCFWFHWKGLEA